VRRFAVAIRLVTSAALAICPVLRPCASPAQQSVHPLPQAIPGANYAAQLAIPPGLGYPFAKCALEGNAPRWLTLDCARLQLKGKVPATAAASTKDADLRVTLHLEDAAGNAREFPLSLRVSAEPQLVSLEDTQSSPVPSPLTEPPTPASQVSAGPAAPTAAKPTSVDKPRNRPKSAPTLRNAALTETVAAHGDAPAATPAPTADAAPGKAAEALEAAPVTPPAGGAAAPAAGTALPVATKGFPYSVPLKVDGATVSGTITFALQSGSALPGGLQLKDAAAGPTIEGTPTAKTTAPQSFTIVESENGAAKLQATYSIAVDDTADNLPKAEGTAGAAALAVTNPIVVGQGYAEFLDVTTAHGCASYAIAPTSPPLGDLGLTFSPATALLSSTTVTLAAGAAPPPPLTLKVTCHQKSSDGDLSASFLIPVLAERAAVGSTGIAPAQSDGTAATPTEFDLGLTRYYFLGGTVLSQQQDQFSHTDLFLGFHLDRVFRAPGPYMRTADAKRKYLLPGISSFLDIRMTSLPVAVQPCPTTGSSTTCSNSSSGSSSSPTPATGDQTQVFLNSQKSARFEGGVYLPFQLREWKPSKAADGYVVDFAPIAKIGFDTSLNGLNQTQQSSSTPSAVLPTGSSNSFYKFWDYGGRLVWSKIAGGAPDSNEAPDLMGYIDIGIGRFSNLATLLCPPGSGGGPPQTQCTIPTVGAPLNHQFQYRIPMEGALEIPGAKGLTIGFSANLSQRGIGPHHYDLLPPDDLRFLFGYKVDVTKFFKNVFGS
jgi:hypothetical protein